MHPGDVLDNYPISFFDDPSTSIVHGDLYPMRGAIQTLQMFSESFKEIDATKDNYWVGLDKVRELVNNRCALKN